MRLPTLLLALALLGAGCITSTQDPVPADDAPADAPLAPAATPEGETPAPATPAQPTPAPRQEADAPPSNATTTGETPPAAPQPREEQVTGSATIPLAVRPPCEAPAPCESAPSEAAAPREPATLDLPQARPSRATLGATWSPEVPAFPELTMNITNADGVLIGAVTGASPLVLEVDLALLGDATRVLVHVSPVAPGAAAQQDVALTLDLRYG